MASVESKPMSEGVQRVAAALQAHGHVHVPMMLDAAARTAQQAADALGIALGQIAKSIIFRRLSDDAAVLVVTAGDQRVDEHKVAALVGPLGRADAAFVKARTGYSIGGVPPLAHATPSVTLIDQSLSRFAEIWAAAGHPHAVFRLSLPDLLRMSGAPLAAVVHLPVVPQISPLAQGLARRATQVLAAPGAVPSPCNSVCRMNAQTALCEGCYRSIDEILAWSSADDQTKRSIWQSIGQRAPSY
jgi:prolyl-tRNA editing enzyme YbaK/EbsC (Cys-tRNA(Pro) deacylase)/predicted Fe-S protein YdhL (DUF1289 family)